MLTKGEVEYQETVMAALKSIAESQKKLAEKATKKVTLEDVKEYAEKQYERANYDGDTDDAVGFEFNGQFIIYPWTDPTGRFERSTEDAVMVYGAENIVKYCLEIANRIRG